MGVSATKLSTGKLVKSLISVCVSGVCVRKCLCVSGVCVRKYILPVYCDTLLWSYNTWLVMSQELEFANGKAGTAKLEATFADFFNLPHSFSSNTSRDFRNALQPSSIIPNLGNALT